MAEVTVERTPSAADGLRQLLRELSKPATERFIVATVGLAWLFWFVLWRADFANFFLISNHDPGAALRTDEIIAQGLRPGVDFFYYYGLLPVMLCRGFFAVFGRSPGALFALLGLLSAAFAAGLVQIVRVFAPSRLGTILVAIGVAHAITPGIPTHALEAAVLVWAVAMRVRGRSAAALALASCAVFVKFSMGVVMLAELATLAVFDAVRERAPRRLAALAAAPVALACTLAATASTFGIASVRASVDPAAGAAVYKAYDLGFFREGKNFWHPAGHTLGWYVGGLAGPWLVGSALLLLLGFGAAVRLARAGLAGAPRGAGVVADEAYAICGFANLAFISLFFAPSAGCVYYYSWVVLAGLVPVLARAHLEMPGPGASPVRRVQPLLWAGATLGLALSATGVMRQFLEFVREPRVEVGGLSTPVDEAAEWKATMSLARATGSGVVTAVARAANFERADPALKQARYWMMLIGMRKTPALDELLSLVHASDTVLVTRHDYAQIVNVPEIHALLTESERLHEGKYFLLLRVKPPVPPP